MPRLITAITLVALILFMWLPFTMHSGFNGETAFVYDSETSSFWHGFTYRDPIRKYTSVFYHVGYLLAEAFRVPGSFVPYQIVHASLWLGRAILTFLILRKFLPGYFPFCFLAGVIVAVHASDGALQWVGQMNQFGFIFWMLLAFYLFNLAIESRRAWVFVLLAVLACLSEYMSLWSYEAQLLLILLAPLTVWIFRRAYHKRTIAASILWYAVPIQYITASVIRYRNMGGATYQQSVLRKGWKAAGVLSDWWFQIRATFEFWDWTRDTPAMLPPGQLTRLTLAGALIVLMGGGAILLALRRRKGPDVLLAPAKPLWHALAAGVVVTILSFPVYLLLPRSLWRTQFLSGFGVGITLAAVTCLACRYCPTRLFRAAIFLICGAAVAYSGVHAAIVRGALGRSLWEYHKSAVAGIVSVLPSVRPETIFIYTNVPKDPDPFMDNMWFDMAMRLAYPDTPVAGEYFYPDGTPASGNCYTFDGEHCRWNGVGIESLVKDTSVRHVVVLEYQKDKPARIVPRFPEFLHVSEDVMSLYSPDIVRADTPVSPLAVRRYGPFPGLQPAEPRR